MRFVKGSGIVLSLRKIPHSGWDCELIYLISSILSYRHQQERQLTALATIELLLFACK